MNEMRHRSSFAWFSTRNLNCTGGIGLEYTDGLEGIECAADPEGLGDPECAADADCLAAGRAHERLKKPSDEDLSNALNDAGGLPVTPRKTGYKTCIGMLCFKSFDL